MEKIADITRENMEEIASKVVEYAVKGWVPGWNTRIFFDPSTMEVLMAIDSGNTGYSPELEELYCIPADIMSEDNIDRELLTEEELEAGINPFDLDDSEERLQNMLEDSFFNYPDSEYNIWKVQKIFSKIFEEGEN